MNRNYSGIAELPTHLRIFPLSGILLLPRGQLPLNIFEPRYVDMVDDALKSDRLIGMVQPAGDSNNSQKLHSIGCVGRLTQISETGDGRYMLTLHGVARFHLIREIVSKDTFRTFEVDYTKFEHDLIDEDKAVTIDRHRLLNILKMFADIAGVQIDLRGTDTMSTEVLINALATLGTFEPSEKQALLEAPNLAARAELLSVLAELASAKKTHGGDTIQ